MKTPRFSALFALGALIAAAVPGPGPAAAQQARPPAAAPQPPATVFQLSTLPALSL